MSTIAKKTTSTNKTATKKATPVQEAPKEQMFTQEQVQAMIAEAVQNAIQQVTAQSAPAAVLESTQEPEGVVMRFFAEVNDANVVYFGKDARYGQVTGKLATVVINKNDFAGGFRDATVQTLLKNRTLVVLSGLNDAERKLYGVDYADGEILTPEECEKLDNAGEKILEIYPKLHPTFKTMIASRFRKKAEDGTLKIDRDTLVKLNRLSRAYEKSAPIEGQKNLGSFHWIIEKMNLEDVL